MVRLEVTAELKSLDSDESSAAVDIGPTAVNCTVLVSVDLSCPLCSSLVTNRRHHQQQQQQQLSTPHLIVILTVGVITAVALLATITVLVVGFYRRRRRRRRHRGSNKLRKPACRYAYSLN